MLAKLRPAFDKDGTVTAGNASGINDGAAAVVLMSAKEARASAASSRSPASSPGRTPGVDPAIMGTGPIPASRMALKKAGWTVDDLDLVEANEAFAAQACAVNKDLGWDTGKVNVNGGAIALGHPIGASGARVLVTLLYEMQQRDAQEGPRDAVHRRRHGHRDVRRARLIAGCRTWTGSSGGPFHPRSRGPAGSTAALGRRRRLGSAVASRRPGAHQGDQVGVSTKGGGAWHGWRW